MWLALGLAFERKYSKPLPFIRLHFKEFKNHSKVIVVDNKYRIVGSNNWLSNRKYSNSEYSIKVFSEIETEEAQKDLAVDF